MPKEYVARKRNGKWTLAYSEREAKLRTNIKAALKRTLAGAGISALLVGGGVWWVEATYHDPTQHFVPVAAARYNPEILTRLIERNGAEAPRPVMPMPRMRPRSYDAG